MALGYRIAARAKEASAQYGIALNPDRDAPIAFATGDRVVVLATG